MPDDRVFLVLLHNVMPGTGIIETDGVCLMKGEDLTTRRVRHINREHDEYTGATASEVSRQWDPEDCEYPYVTKEPLGSERMF